MRTIIYWQLCGEWACLQNSCVPRGSSSCKDPGGGSDSVTQSLGMHPLCHELTLHQSPQLHLWRELCDWSSTPVPPVLPCACYGSDLWLCKVDPNISTVPCFSLIQQMIKLLNKKLAQLFKADTVQLAFQLLLLVCRSRNSSLVFDPFL